MNGPTVVRNFFSRRVLLLIATAVCAVAHGSPHGELDATFGKNGRLTIGPRYESTLGGAVAQQLADGKLVIVGASWLTPTGWYDFFVIRLNADGSRDQTFGTDGTALIDFAGGTDIATDVAIQSDGKIVVAGQAQISGGDTDIALTRLNTNGTIDATFGTGGRTTLSLGGDREYTAKIALLANGKIVVVGGTNADGDFDAVFARFEANGRLDTSFGTGALAGTTRVDSANNIQDMPYSMTLQSDGKIIACGHSGPFEFDPPNGQLLAIRVNASGSLDASFGNNGVARIAALASRGSGRGCVAMPDGTTILAGFAGSASREDLLLTRLTSNGALDTSFASEGLSTINLGGSESVQSIIRLADGQLGVAGLTGILTNEFSPNKGSWGFDAPSEYSHVFIARIDAASGLLDADFGNGGVTLVDFSDDNVRARAFARGLIQQADGKLLAVGEDFQWGDWLNYREIVLTRVDPAGAGNAGVASFVEATTRSGEESGRVVVSVRRTGGIAEALSVNYSTAPGVDSSSADYIASSGTLTWPAGDAADKLITVTITNDNSVEHTEYFGIVLTGPENHLGLSSTSVAIADNDSKSAPKPPSQPDALGGGAISGLELLALALICSYAVLLRRRQTTAR